MSFRNRLTSFFIVIVLVPMLAVGVLVFRLISENGQAKSGARANGLAAAAAAQYTADEEAMTADASAIAQDVGTQPAAVLRVKLRTSLSEFNLARVVVVRDGATIADVGNPNAIAPGVARATNGSTSVSVSATTARQFVDSLSGGASKYVIVEDRRLLASTVPAALPRAFPRNSQVTIGGTHYSTATDELAGFDGSRSVQLTALSNTSISTTSVSSTRVLATAFLAGFVGLAFAFAVFASRGLEGQVGRFLRAARRLGGGDFSNPVPVEGSDEFAMLAVEFNNMSEQLEERLEDLHAERRRLRESIRRAGDVLASNLDRTALLELVMQTVVDGVEAQFGRLSVRSDDDGPLWEVVRESSLAGAEGSILAAEKGALGGTGFGEGSEGDVHVASVPLGPVSTSGRPHGLVTVGRRGEPFTADDTDLLRSLVGQATLALENIELHQEVQRQAVTDRLTGLANHGRFQEVLSGEMEQVRRYRYPVGLIMLDIDNFKRINDTYGHPQGDLVLRHVARVLKDTSREADSAARYGGEEMALILPHTDLEGSYAIAERIRTAIAGLDVPRLDGQGTLQVTASFGVAASTGGQKDPLIADTDAALYRAKREGKNRTVRATSATANVVASE